MKAFLVGLIFLIAAAIFVCIGYLLFPFLVVLGLFLRMALIIAFVIFGIWLLGKLIIYIWEKLRSK